MSKMQNTQDKGYIAKSLTERSSLENSNKWDKLLAVLYTNC